MLARDYVCRKLKLKRKAKAPEMRKKKKHKKHQDQISLVTESQKELAAGRLETVYEGKESDDHVLQETAYFYDGFLGKEVPVDGRKMSCMVCGSWDHYYMICPFQKYFPKGTKIGVHFETICKGCDRIGRICCNKGGYAMIKSCSYCNSDGHCRPKDVVYKKQEFFDDRVDEDEKEYVCRFSYF